MSYSNYEQTVIINNVALSGVESVGGSYGISERPIRVAGVGFIDALVGQPLEGNFSISRKMVSRDPLLALDGDSYAYDEQEISGAILYDNATKGFGFTKGRINKYSVSCGVGDIPNIQTDITFYGNLGKDVLVEQATVDHPPIQFPDQSSISDNVSDFQIDAISDFSYSRALNLNPVYALPKGDENDWSNSDPPSTPNMEPVQVDTQYPIETDISFTMIVNEYQIREMKDRVAAAPKSTVVIEIKDAKDGSMINSFTGQNVRLISESIQSSVAGEMAISLSYKGYETLHNPAS